MEEKKQKHHFSLGTTVLISCVTLFLGVGTGFFIYATCSPYALNDEEKQIVDAYRLLKDDWLFGEESQYLHQNALDGMLTSVAQEEDDPYTFYTGNMEDQGLSTDNSGFGFNTHTYDGYFYITAVHPNSSASKAGLRKGDILTRVTVKDESRNFSDYSYDENLSFLSSFPTDTSFVFEVQRGEQTLSVSLKKAEYTDRLLDLVQAPTDENNHTMMVKIDTFLGNPTAALQGTLDLYQGKIDHLIFDLRGNGGGYLNQSESMAKLFVPKGSFIDMLVDKNGKVYSSCYQKEEPRYSIERFTILVDSKTASASESFTLAMRANTNCEVVGFTSYGKGIAQQFKQFSDGSVIRFTYAYVYGPERGYQESKDAICIHKKGITPDQEYERDFNFLYKVANYTTSLGISTAGQQFFLDAMQYIYPEQYPLTYSATYHFTDAIKQYGEDSYLKYGREAYQHPFNEDGTVSKKLNDLFVKECFDQYLIYEQKLLDWTLTQ